jgi:hypothetical protein
MSEPLLYFLVRLLHECPHRQAIDEAAGPRGVESRGLRVESRLQYSIPQPREDDGCGLAEAGGDVDEAGFTRAFGEATLVIVGFRLVGGTSEEGGVFDGVIHVASLFADFAFWLRAIP